MLLVTLRRSCRARRSSCEAFTSLARQREWAYVRQIGSPPPNEAPYGAFALLMAQLTAVATRHVFVVA